MAQEMLLEGSLVLPAKLEAAGFKFDYSNLEKALNHELKATAGSAA
jgi:NAD dependent epimerase/dehydratase family enzyme